MDMSFGKKRQQRRELIKKASHQRLRRNLQILAVVYSVLILVTIYHLFTTHVVWWQMALCIAIGLAVGIVTSRMMKIDWDKDQEKVVGRIDVYGAIILVLFILFEVFRTRIVELFASNGSIGTLSLLLLAFTLYGRILGMVKRILAIARENFN